MSQTIVRLQGLELRNIKNVEFGKLKCLIVIKMREDIIIQRY